MAAVAYRLSFGIAIAILLASFVMGVLAAERDVGSLPALPSADLLDVARLLDESGGSDEWVDQMRSYTEIQPRNSFAWRELGVAHKKREEHEAAIVACKRAIALGDPNGRCHAVLAKTYLKLGREELARFHANRALEKGLRLSPKLRALAEGAEAS